MLIAEDNPVNQIVAVRTLERCGYRAEVVSDGREALEALRARRYDAVLMDCQMPGSTATRRPRELRRRERRRRPHVRDRDDRARDGGDRERASPRAWTTT